MTRYVTTIVLRRCVGCQTCTAACKGANATPPGIQWRRVLDIETGEFPDVRRTFLPMAAGSRGVAPQRPTTAMAATSMAQIFCMPRLPTVMPTLLPALMRGASSSIWAVISATASSTLGRIND